MSKTGYIYKLSIRDGSLEDCYIGSTYRIRQRKIQHKSRCNNVNAKAHNYYVYQFIRDHDGFDNWDLYALEEVKYDNKIDLHKKEREWIEKLKPKLNKQIPTRTNKEWHQDNKDNLKQYKQDNADKIKAQQSTKIKCECGSETSRVHKARHERSAKHQKFIADNNI